MRNKLPHPSRYLSVPLWYISGDDERKGTGTANDMNLIFKLHAFKQPQTEEMGELRPARFWPEQDAMTAIDSFLAPRNLTASQLFKHRKPQAFRDLPWTTLILRRGASLAGHFAELRHSRTDVILSNIALWTGAKIDDTQIENVEIIEFFRHPIMFELAAKSPAIAPVWELLKDKPPSGYWLCLCDQLSGDWMEKACRDSLARYRKAEARNWQPTRFDPAVLTSPVAQLDYWTALAFKDDRNYDQAIERLEPLCRDYPQESWLWKLKADCHLFAHRPVEALRDFGDALTLIPGWRNAKVGMAMAHRDNGDRKAAKALLEEVLKEAPHHLLALPELLNLLEKQPPWERDLDTHLQLANRLVGMEPQRALNWSRLGYVLTLDKRYNDAQRMFRQAVKMNPDSANYWNNLGFVLATSNQLLNQAEDACLTALRLNPTLAGAWDSLGLTHLRMGLPKRALQEFKKAVALNPELLDGWQNLARTYRRLGDQNSAITAWERIAQLALPDNISTKAKVPQGPLGELFDKPPTRLTTITVEAYLTAKAEYENALQSTKSQK